VLTEAVYESIQGEEEDYSEDLYNITSWGADVSFRELITMYEEGELLKPEFQRNYVWDKSEASRFIESILMGLPVPSIFLANMENEKRLIIDGYQRIMTIYDYVKKGVFSKDQKTFKLSNSPSINVKWKGKAFNELGETDQRKIRNTTIHAIIFEQKSPKDDDTSLFQVFERINTSGRPLTPQEIRNCVYQGVFNKLLINLNSLSSWRFLYGTEIPDSRMKDMEFILRFFSLGDSSVKNNTATQIFLKKQLNMYMGSLSSRDSSEMDKRRVEFTKTMDFIFHNMGSKAFHNMSPGRDAPLPRFNPTIFDSISIATAYALNKQPDLVVNDLPDKRLSLLANKEFQGFGSERTTNISSINGRISLALSHLYGMNYE